MRTALYEINFGGKTDVQHRKLSKRTYMAVVAIPAVIAKNE